MSTLLSECPNGFFGYQDCQISNLGYLGCKVFLFPVFLKEDSAKHISAPPPRISHLCQWKQRKVNSPWRLAGYATDYTIVTRTTCDLLPVTKLTREYRTGSNPRWREKGISCHLCSPWKETVIRSGKLQNFCYWTPNTRATAVRRWAYSIGIV